ncbi:hypothetical protein AAES_108375 [Amazona aestiva]|uniref:Securin n=1 Tax=Amazona aestiva TaxID=12930 RepID=A0A0Q3PT61_AMAAE|nr:hypothetical protein AAES_108375 [Amazona aestiva]
MRVPPRTQSGRSERRSPPPPAAPLPQPRAHVYLPGRTDTESAPRSHLINLNMATLIFIDQENDEVGATKNRLRLPSGSSDFESFDLPEEHKLSNINLHGVPLMVFERTYERCVKMVPSPVKIEEVSWKSNLLQSTADFLDTLDEIIDMPPPNYDI